MLFCKFQMAVLVFSAHDVILKNLQQDISLFSSYQVSSSFKESLKANHWQTSFLDAKLMKNCIFNNYGIDFFFSSTDSQMDVCTKQRFTISSIA